MAKAIIDEQSLTDIADAIRAKNGSADTYTPSEMATAISNLPSGGDIGSYCQIRSAKFITEANSVSNAAALLTYLRDKMTEYGAGDYLLGWSVTSPVEVYNAYWCSSTNGTGLVIRPSVEYGFRYRDGALTSTAMGNGYSAVLPAGVEIVIYGFTFVNPTAI